MGLLYGRASIDFGEASVGAGGGHGSRPLGVRRKV